LSSFKEKDLIGKPASEVLGEVHGFVDERVLHNDGATPDDLKEIKAALDAWCKDTFGVVPIDLLKKRTSH